MGKDKEQRDLNILDEVLKADLEELAEKHNTTVNQIIGLFISNTENTVKETLEDTDFSKRYVNLDKEYIDDLKRYKHYNEDKYNIMYKFISFRKDEENYYIVFNLDGKEELYPYKNRREFRDNIIKIESKIIKYIGFSGFGIPNEEDQQLIEKWQKEKSYLFNKMKGNIDFQESTIGFQVGEEEWLYFDRLQEIKKSSNFYDSAFMVSKKGKKRVKKELMEKIINLFGKEYLKEFKDLLSLDESCYHLYDLAGHNTGYSYYIDLDTGYITYNIKTALRYTFYMNK